MAGLQSNSANAAVALLAAAGDPERTKAAIARMEEKETSAREAAKIARAEITLLETKRKELDSHEKALASAQAKSEQDLVARQAAVAKSEETLKRRGQSVEDDRAVLRAEQTTHKLTSRVEMDKLKNLEISLSGREKGLKQEKAKLEAQGISLRIAEVTANNVKADYEAKALKLTAALAD